MKEQGAYLQKSGVILGQELDWGGLGPAVCIQAGDGAGGGKKELKTHLWWLPSKGVRPC